MENDKTFIRTVSEYFSNTDIPDTWESLESFVIWYLDSRMPLMIPWDAEVHKTDDATAICVFKKAPYQVEMYVIHPGMTIPVHGHPGMEVVTVILGGGKLHKKGLHGVGEGWGRMSPKLIDGQVHGGISTNFSNGYMLLSFEKWPDNTEITSAAIQWKGNTAGPIHDTLIAKHYKNAVISDGYADITIGAIKND
jgi:hypothetical protein